ncbi:MAG: HDOD domain-containing protein [Candidatus Solibacter sp.]
MTTLTQSVMLNRRQLLTAVPPFRPVAVKLLTLVEGPSLHLAQIVGLLRSDAVISAELIRAANSPLFGSRFEIRSPLQALVYLGLDRVKALVVTTAMKSLADATHGKLTVCCWRHNLATALICQKFSTDVNLQSERCYIGGLIHDIGRLALLSAFPEYQTLGMPAVSGAHDALSAEKNLLGLDHAEAGRWLLSQWGCPLELQNVAGFHENPAEAPNCDRALVSLVWAASHLADSMGMSAFPSTEPVQWPAIVSILSELAGEELTVDIEEIAEWVAARVNGIELNLA